MNVDTDACKQASDTVIGLVFWNKVSARQLTIPKQDQMQTRAAESLRYSHCTDIACTFTCCFQSFELVGSYLVSGHDV